MYGMLYLYCLYYYDIRYCNIILKYDWLCGEWVELPGKWSEFMFLLAHNGGGISGVRLYTVRRVTVTQHRMICTLYFVWNIYHFSQTKCFLSSQPSSFQWYPKSPLTYAQFSSPWWLLGCPGAQSEKVKPDPVLVHVHSPSCRMSVAPIQYSLGL